MGTIEKRGKNSWRVREWVYLGSKRYPVDIPLRYPASMSEEEQMAAAQQELRKLEMDISAGAAAPAAAKLSLKEFSDIWMQEYVIPSTSPVNAANLRHQLDKHLLPHLGEVKLHKLTPIMITQWLNTLRRTPKAVQSLPPDQRVRKPADPKKLQQEMIKYKAQMEKRAANPPTLSNRTVHHYFVTLHGMLEKAVQWEYLDRNPCDKVDSPKYKKRKMRVIDDQQSVELLRKLEREPLLSFRCAVLLALLCGLRLGEVGALCWSDVDFDNGTISIERALKYTAITGQFIDSPKSDAGERIIDLPPGMITLLKNTKEFQDISALLLDDGWHGVDRIVCKWDGSPYHHSTPSKQWRKFADKNGYPGLRFHELRHTHASLLLAGSQDAVSVASRMGHSDASTTLRQYAHAYRIKDKISVQLMQQLIEHAQDPDATAHDPAMQNIMELRTFVEEHADQIYKK